MSIENSDHLCWPQCIKLHWRSNSWDKQLCTYCVNANKRIHTSGQCLCTHKRIHTYLCTHIHTCIGIYVCIICDDFVDTAIIFIGPMIIYTYLMQKRHYFFQRTYTFILPTANALSNSYVIKHWSAYDRDKHLYVPCECHEAWYATIEVEALWSRRHQLLIQYHVHVDTVKPLIQVAN